MNERDWDRVAASWDEHIMSSLEENTNGSIAALIGEVAASHRSILDYGCGVGRYLPLLSSRFDREFPMAARRSAGGGRRRRRTAAQARGRQPD